MSYIPVVQNRHVVLSQVKTLENVNIRDIQVIIVVINLFIDTNHEDQVPHFSDKIIVVFFSYDL